MLNRIENLQKWLLNSNYGRYLLEQERQFYFNACERIFGYYALQLGFPKIDFLENNRINNQYTIGYDIRCKLDSLPFVSNSVDLIICPHIIELSPDNWVETLQECHRVLIPNGQLIITSFNKFSLFQMWNLCQGEFESLKLQALYKVKKVLTNEQFRLSGGSFLTYLPPSNNSKFLNSNPWIDHAGNRWFPSLANMYTLKATKVITSVTPMVIPPKNKAKTQKQFEPIQFKK